MSSQKHGPIRLGRPPISRILTETPLAESAGLDKAPDKIRAKLDSGHWMTLTRADSPSHIQWWEHRCCHCGVGVRVDQERIIAWAKPDMERTPVGRWPEKWGGRGMTTEPKNLPIHFSPPMVQAIMAGRKTVTRRLAGVPGLGGKKKRAESPLAKARPGDVLWVRERFALDWAFDDLSPLKVLGRCRESGVDANVWFAADSQLGVDDARGKWRPPMFMPRDLCRTWLRVTAVRTELLGELTDEGAMAEGCITHLCPPSKEFPSGRCYRMEGQGADTPLPWRARPRAAFVDYWAHLHGPDSWTPDQPVLVLGFEGRAA